MSKKEIRYNLRITSEELVQWRACAVVEEISLSAWIRQRCNDGIPSKEEQTENLRIAKEFEEKFKPGTTVNIKMPQRLMEHDKTCQCGICDFRRKNLK
jgi:hypothetical protein